MRYINMMTAYFIRRILLIIPTFLGITILVFTMESGFMTPYGVIYLIVLGITYYFVLKMKDTIEATMKA